ncbi:MAG: PP2C family protein-serine/threonine phosphatase [Blastocatellia bacterium]
MAGTNEAAVKLIKKTLSGRIDAALSEHVQTTERWAGYVRLFFLVHFSFAAGLAWGQPGPGRLIFLGMAVAWLAEILLLTIWQKGAPSSRQVVFNTFLDVTIVNLGLLAWWWQGLFPAEGQGLFFCYFPLLALAANRYRISLVLLVGGYAVAFYGILSLLVGTNVGWQLGMFGITALVLVMGSRRPKRLVGEVSEEAVDSAHRLGVDQTTLSMAEQSHALVLPPSIVELPGLWCTAKHAPGARTNGDYYHVFETADGPLLAVGELGGEDFEALRAVSSLHQELARVVARETELSAILRALNSYMVKKYRGRRSLACLLARWEGEQLRYINAGLLPMIQMSKPQGAQAVNQHSLPVTMAAIGVAEEIVVEESVVPFPVRDLMVVYTDGVFAKLASDRQKGITEIEAMAERFSSGEVNTLCHRIFDCAQPGFERNPDDSTVIVVRRQPEAKSE